MKAFQISILILLSIFMSSCGFHLRGQMPLSPALQNLYIKTKTPYSTFTHNLRQYLIMSKVNLTDSPEAATTILEILSEVNGQQLVSVSPTLQTRTYNLTVTINFQITTPNGKILVPPQAVTETRQLPVYSSQVLAGSNQATNMTQDMRRAIVFDMMNILSARITTMQLSKVNPNQ